MSRESNPKFQEALVSALKEKEASESLVQSASIFVAEHLDAFNEWLQSFLQYLTIGGKDVTTAEDAELAAVVVEELTEANVDPLDHVETPDSETTSQTDPLDSVPAATGQTASDEANASDSDTETSEDEEEDAE